MRDETKEYEYTDSYIIRNSILFALRKTHDQLDISQVDAIYKAITEQFVLDKLIEFNAGRKRIKKLFMRGN